MVNNGVHVFNRNNALPIVNNISGTGSLTKLGNNTITLTGNNSYTGTTTISGGTLAIGAGTTSGAIGTGNVVNNAALVFNRSDSTTIANNISGIGSLSKVGSTLILTGSNSYSGTTTISSGLLVVGAGTASGSLGTGNVSLLQGSSLEFNRSDAVTFAGNITGSGSLQKAGAGALVLLGANNYNMTVVLTGTLQVGNGGAAGTLGTGSVTILTGSSLVFDRSDTVTIGNTITGGGSLIQAGGGTLVLSGTSSYTGATNVTSGTLKVTGALTGGEVTAYGGSSINVSTGGTLTASSLLAPGQLTNNGAVNSNITIASGGTLAGTGTIVGSLTMQPGSTYAPGNSPGIQHVMGDATWNNMTYSMQIADAAGAQGIAYDSIDIVGKLTIDSGAIIDVNLDSYPPNSAVANFNGGSPFDLILVSTTLGVDGFDASNFHIHPEAFALANPFSGDFSVILSGNDLLLHFATAVPEPGTLLLVSFAGCACALAWRTRRRPGTAGTTRGPV